MFITILISYLTCNEEIHQLSILEEGGVKFIMIFFYVLFAFLVIVGIASIDHTLKKKLKNDERIIERLDLIWKEIKELKDRAQY